jgi:hypothetical protein
MRFHKSMIASIVGEDALRAKSISQLCDFNPNKSKISRNISPAPARMPNRLNSDPRALFRAVKANRPVRI